MLGIVGSCRAVSVDFLDSFEENTAGTSSTNSYVDLLSGVERWQARTSTDSERTL
jgi:hypothetical protein